MHGSAFAVLIQLLSVPFPVAAALHRAQRALAAFLPLAPGLCASLLPWPGALSDASQMHECRAVSVGYRSLGCAEESSHRLLSCL